MSPYEKLYTLLEAGTDPHGHAGRIIRGITAPETSLRTVYVKSTYPKKRKTPKVKEGVRTERPGVHSVSRLDIAKWKRLRQKATTNAAVRGRIAALIKTRQGKAKEDF